VSYAQLTEHASEMCECAELYPPTKHDAADTLKNPTNFYMPYGSLCSRYQAEGYRRLSDFLVRHPEYARKFFAEDAAGLR
jgi:hypothetical protein